MQLIYTRHARQRMKQRKVTEQQVEETVADPDEIIPGDNGGDIAIRRYNEREVRVVYNEQSTDVFVVYTVMKPHVRDR